LALATVNAYADQPLDDAAELASSRDAQWSGTLSKSRLGHLDRVIKQYDDEGRITCAVGSVRQNGETMYEGAVGWSDKEAKRRMAHDTIFRIASQTKALTSVAILQLLEEGRLTLEAPVSQFIPEFSQAQVAVEKDGAAELVPLER